MKTTLAPASTLALKWRISASGLSLCGWPSGAGDLRNGEKVSPEPLEVAPTRRERRGTHADVEVVAVLLADVAHEVDGVVEAALDGLPLLDAARRVAAQSEDVAAARVVRLLQVVDCGEQKSEREREKGEGDAP